jgi:hypothetical protein
MRQGYCRLTSQDVRREVEAELAQHVPLPDYKRSLTGSQLHHLLLAMACWGCSLFTASRRLKGFPSHETARQAVLVGLPDTALLVRRLVNALHCRLPRSFRKRRWDLACDLHQEPFYGDPKTTGVRGGKAKAGTKYFWTYATCALVHKGRRWTVALLPVTSNAMDQVLPALLEQLKRAGIQVRTLLLDRGFYSAEVIHSLQDKHIPFVMPAVKKGRLDGANGPTGTSGYFAKTSDGLYEYRWRKKGRKSGLEVCVKLAVAVHSRRLSAREKKKGKKAGKGGWAKVAWVFAYWGLDVQQARSLVGRYKKRFGIESSYRQLRQGLGATSSKDERLRLMLVGLALILRNVWVWLHWQVLSGRRRGFRLLNPGLLTLPDLLFWVIEELKNLYGVRLEVEAQRLC